MNALALVVPGGLGVFEGPSAGFLIGFPFGAAAIGLLCPPGGRWATSWWRIGLAMVVGGIVVVYAFGIPGMAWKTGLSLWQATKAAWVFIPGDILKHRLRLLAGSRWELRNVSQG